MMKTFYLPDLGEGLQEAEIVAWQVNEGDRVVMDQPLLSVETAKAIVDVPSPFSGTVHRLHVAVGDIVLLGAALVDIDEGEAISDSGSVVGDMRMASHETAAVAAPVVAATAARVLAGRGVKAMPAVRALAARLNVDLTGVVGSGPNGVIVAADVEAAATASVPKPLTEGYAELRGPRRAMAQTMARAQSEVVLVTITDEADIHHWAADEDMTWRMLRAIGRACQAAPALNAWFDGARLARCVHAHVDVGLAVSIGDDLFVPVLRDVQNRSRADLRAAINAMKEDLAARRIAPEHMKNPTISLSNFGMLAGRYATPIVVPPQVTIVGSGRVREEVRAVAGEICVRCVMPLSLSFDHRAVTGAEAATFLAILIEDLQSPSGEADAGL